MFWSWDSSQLELRWPLILIDCDIHFVLEKLAGESSFACWTLQEGETSAQLRVQSVFYFQWKMSTLEDANVYKFIIEISIWIFMVGHAKEFFCTP